MSQGNAEFDYIIVGGGVAGVVLASRLSELLPDLSILLIEAGPESDPRVAPSLALAVSPHEDIQWAHRTVPQAALEGRTVSQEQGKILGGGSAINYQAWTRGASVEFDRWAEEVGDRKWSWDGILPYFKKIETFVPSVEMGEEKREDIHGYSGPITITHTTSSGKPRNYPLRSMVEDVYKNTGLPRAPNGDGNGGQTIGYSESASCTFNGNRQWSASSYPLGLSVTLWPNTVVRNLLLRDNKAIGVALLPNADGEKHVLARKEVLVCGGAQGSPRVLLLSGIGPKAELDKHGITQVVELPVGENYSEHPLLATFWKVRDSGLCLGDAELITEDCDWTAGTPADYFSYERHDDEELAQLAKQTLNPLDLERFQIDGRPHTESFVMYGHFDLTHKIPNPGGSVFVMFNILTAPSSRGTVRLSSSSPLDAPILDPALFKDPLDEKLVYACARMTSNAIQNSIAVSKYGAVEYGIDEELRGDFSDEALRKRLLNSVETVNHGSGTCAMGTVVDSDCKVKGVQGLRVIDSSVIPFPLGAHYQAIVYAMAEQMADVLAHSS